VWCVWDGGENLERLLVEDRLRNIKKEVVKSMRILGIHDGHNASAALLVDGEVVAAVEEERLRRIKNWNGFPELAIGEVLCLGGLDAQDLDAVGLNGNHMPYPTTREDLLVQYGNAQSVLTRLMLSIVRTPIGNAYYGRRRAMRRDQVTSLGVQADKIHFVEHHTCHAAAAYYGLGNYSEPILVFTNDGSGDRLCATLSIGEKGKLRRIATVREGNSIGQLYAVTTFMMGMVPREHEYKLMGMAPYAPEKGRDSVYTDLRALIKFADNGLTWRRSNGCPQTFRSYDFLRKKYELKRFDWICAGLQRFTEEVLVEWVRNGIKATGVKKVALSGGTFMNVKANKLIAELPEVESVFVFPSCGDESNAIGAAVWLQAELGGAHDQPLPCPIGPLYLGPSSSPANGQAALEMAQGKGWRVQTPTSMPEAVADLLAEGEVVARCGGRLEFGARALGNRSILADASRGDVVRVINDAIKNRDFWMPFAPSLMAEHGTITWLTPSILPHRT